MEDHELVEAARTGEPSAFSELVRRHRARAVGMAQAMVRDPHLADDIVQEALIRAFMHLGTLVDGKRFIPWLQQIVRRQALMKLRRGGVYGKERPFSSFEETAAEWDARDLDSILFHLRRSVAKREGEEDPGERVERREVFDVLQHLIGCLSKREREIFIAYFFRQLTPQEIADLYATSTGNVYTALHRAKQKVQKERYRVYLKFQIEKRKGMGCLSRKVLEEPSFLYQKEGSYAAMPLMMHAALRYTEKDDLSLTEVMGLTSHAFRFQAGPEMSPAGPTAFDWKSVAVQGLKALGFSGKAVSTGTRMTEPTPEDLAEGLALVQDSIDDGVPVIAWNLDSAGFGLIYGYDDERQVFHGWDVSAPGKELAYDQLGRGQYPELFVLALGKRTEEAHRTVDLVPISPQTELKLRNYRETLRLALEMAIRHARGEERAALPGYAVGLAAYDVFADALLQGAAHPFGSAYTAAVVGEARKSAAEFLTRLSRPYRHFRTLQPHHYQFQQLAALAAAHYARVSAAWLGIEALFPFPAAQDEITVDVREKAITLLAEAKAAEEQGVAVLESMYECVKS
ncbi:sigma-70 family RNA polymerase sigma factor [Tumebacillus sp. DT12]|uniref:RNA polymerase sigma factor n=1 Tax=Tumebacillus lacus TaxID=2995335 RepID=A0ABT3X581_9BACL|nr:sigma-70 family RNA polymerase sigma factor [Tumebacillus lacus]MCX7572058.1 sigma-70 family RNA polymerase sigma factor [Tumebacillus lacus]